MKSRLTAGVVASPTHSLAHILRKFRIDILWSWSWAGGDGVSVPLQWFQFICRALQAVLFKFQRPVKPLS